MDFTTAVNLFKHDRIRQLSSTDAGMRFLKLRSLARKQHLEYLSDKYSIDIARAKSSDWLKIIYQSALSLNAIDGAIRDIYAKERELSRKNEAQLINELYKIQSFEWGGLHQNSLEKTIIDNYVKKITAYNSLRHAIENDLYNSMRAYVCASWYNHWSSIIIEGVFKDHCKVIPAVGRIKKIDFFINDKPFDLKVTYLPEGYVKQYRKSNNLRPELSLMKQTSRKLNLRFDRAAADSVLLADLWQKLDDHPHPSAVELIANLQECRNTLLNAAIDNPEPLVRWLYENQGARRFDAANRLFLILVDTANFFDSWKLKRARPLISEKVTAYLDKADSKIGFQLDFDWQGDTYNVLSDALFVVK